ncbi:DNA-binding response OmpR family regulator [Inhella inkyongensis]|uniref:DNA-binding response OmpR family regulator n=1 Tax=Inhella inkyongensis TaxID=392593 RepID=A0A840S1X0_9BURK|nr:response regulator [Inhella inkyongensis]MBB5202854.1 DNA-binding response OmpR family regulator [Inhella inkyongensis]
MSDRALVMVVDDDPIMQSLYEDALSPDFELLPANSGVEALALLEQRRPDVVLMDVDMPGLDGYQTCRLLQANMVQAPPVLFVSARDQLQDRMRGYDAGGSDYVCKPWQAPELVIKIRRLLEQVSQTKALEGERDEAVNAVLSSADMAGELGVVLDFQRGLNTCRDYRAVADLLFQTLERYDLDGCLRISGRGGALSINRSGQCSALEWSILESLAAQTEGPRIRPIHQNTSFNFGQIILFVRNLTMCRSADMEAEARERQGRAIDNVALLLEGAVARLATLDSGQVEQDLDRIRRMVQLTKSALANVAQRNRAISATVHQSFEQLQNELEESFVHLGLMRSQEEHLTELVKAHAQTAMAALEQARDTEAALRRIVQELDG